MASPLFEKHFEPVDRAADEGDAKAIYVRKEDPSYKIGEQQKKQDDEKAKDIDP
jgi:hypothetical protein